MEYSTSHVSSTQEKFILQALSNVQKVIIYKLGSSYQDSFEDLRQRIFYKIWLWRCRNKKDLTLEEWQKIINVTVNTEISEYFTEKYHQEISFSQMDEYFQEKLCSNKSLTRRIEGNSEIEVRSILLLIWKEMKKLTLRQRFAFFLSDSDLLVEFIYCNCCSTKELAACFELSETEFVEFLNSLPITTEKIAIILETKIKKRISPKLIWEAKSKAKAKLTKVINDYFCK